jgi:hypothetical protein
MYRIAVVTNANEVEHSKYADTLRVLRTALTECNDAGRRGNSYHFVPFDKFNINKLFMSTESDLLTFDSLILATNSLSFDEALYIALAANKTRLAEFLMRDRGICILSQKKLSNRNLSNDSYDATGLLPEEYDYYLFDRPEKFSSDGEATVRSHDSLLRYPYAITNELIGSRCQTNQFMHHTYRSLIIPKYPASFVTLISDNTSSQILYDPLQYQDGDRKLLLSARHKRIVISSMALDWANHAELLCNIVTFITERGPRTLFVQKEQERHTHGIIDSYILRANSANMPYRVIAERSLENWHHQPCDTFIFSPASEIAEIDEAYATLVATRTAYFSLFHIHKMNAAPPHKYALTKYSNFSSIDLMKDGVIRNLLNAHSINAWNNSVWTYSYIATLLEFFDVNEPSIARRVYQELGNHFTKGEEQRGGTELIGSYDNVINATCKMLEVLQYFRIRYGDAAISDGARHDIGTVIIRAEEWLTERLRSGAVADHDVCYCLTYFSKSGRLALLDAATIAALNNLFTQLLASVSEEMLSDKIAYRSGVELARIHQALCVIPESQIFTHARLLMYLQNIEASLVARQDPFGNLANVSETAEVTSILLEGYDARTRVDPNTSTVGQLLTGGIQALYTHFDPHTYAWGDDLNATAKAMYAVGAYDRRFNFAINDFFTDLRGTPELRSLRP